MIKTNENKRIRWKLILWVLLVLAMIETGVWLWFGRVLEDGTMQSVSVWFWVIINLVCLVLWWVFLSRTPWTVRLAGVIAVGIGVVGVKTLIRIDGFSGKMVPRLAFRWSMTPEESSEAKRQSIGASNPGQVGTRSEKPVEVTNRDWPGYRGANRDAIVKSLRFPLKSEGYQEIWRIPVGLGWGSFAVVGQSAFTQEQHADLEYVVCYDAESGKVIWEHDDVVRFSESLGGDGPRATPTFHEGRLYVLGATGILNCLNAADGRLHWSVDILKDNGASNLSWAMAGSPLIYGSNVIVAPGGTDSNSVVAYDLETGKRSWSGGNDPASYSSPVIATLHGVEQILVHNAVGLSAHEVDGGKLLWNFPWSNSPGIHPAQPEISGKSRILISCGYGKGSILLQPDLMDSGWQVEPVWSSRRLKAKFNPFVLKDGFAFGLDEGILVCIDLETGQRRWKGGRYGYGQILLAEDTLLVLAESGDVVIVKASVEDHFELDRFKAFEGKTWGHPAVAQGKLFVRNGQEAVCYRIQEI